MSDGVRWENLLYVLSSWALQFVAKGPWKILCRSVDEVFLVEAFTLLCGFLWRKLFNSELDCLMCLTFINMTFKNIIFHAFLNFSLPSLYFSFCFILDEACRMMFRSLAYFPLHIFLLTSLLLQKVLERQLEQDFLGKEGNDKVANWHFYYLWGQEKI